MSTGAYTNSRRDLYRPPSRPSAPGVPDFRAQFPELQTSPDVVIANAITTAYAMHSQVRLATLYLAAHLVVLTAEDTGKPDGGSGEITSETSVGGKMVMYMQMAESGREIFYTRTSYGRTFITLERRSARRGMPFLLG